MNRLLEESIRNADGRYLSDRELSPLEHYAHSYHNRLNTYTLLHQNADQLVTRSLQQMGVSDPYVTQHKTTCFRDMSYVVRMVAIALLRDDEDGFKQEFVLWMQNILAALHKDAQSAKAYRILQITIANELPSDNAKLVNHYLSEFIAALSTNRP
ncbi:phycobilisome protein [Leptolyngbya sp. AN02str]|uniref:phycobilisome protein n=1 Tax=Leptolyngbya sp. AN02str TaxID=3423363 RepID=UPI003D311DEC